MSRRRLAEAMARKTPITFDTVREIASTLPGVEESIAYGTPVLRVNGHIFAGIPIKTVSKQTLAITVCLGVKHAYTKATKRRPKRSGDGSNQREKEF